MTPFIHCAVGKGAQSFTGCLPLEQAFNVLIFILLLMSNRLLKYFGIFNHVLAFDLWCRKGFVLWLVRYATLQRHKCVISETQTEDQKNKHGQFCIAFVQR